MLLKQKDFLTRPTAYISLHSFLLKEFIGYESNILLLGI